MMDHLRFEAIPDTIPDIPESAPHAELLTPENAKPGDPLSSYFSGIVNSLDGAHQALEGAQQAENAFIAGKGGLQEMIFERARADSILQVASSVASKGAQAISSIMNMQL